MLTEEYIHVHIHTNTHTHSVHVMIHIKVRQGKKNGSSQCGQLEKLNCPEQDSNLQNPAYMAVGSMPTKPPRQLSVRAESSKIRECNANSTQYENVHTVQ